MDKPSEVNVNSNRKCAEISFIKSPHNFWLRLEENKSDYTELLTQLQSEYENAHDDLELVATDLQLGSIYCTFNHKLFEWHRCEILVINKTDVYISYIDIGQNDLIPLKSIKKLKPQFQSQPSFALHCTLSGVKPIDSSVWPLEAITEFSKLTLKKVVTMNIKSKIDNLYHIDLFVKNVNLSEHLIKNGLASVQEDLSIIQTSTKIPAFKFDPTKEYEITATNILSPFCFYVQINEHLDKFFEFEQELQEYYSNVPLEGQMVQTPFIGLVCAAKFTEDQQWYRALIKEIDVETNTYRVYFIDYGNEDTVTLKDLLKLDPKYSIQPSMAIKCCIDGIKPPVEGFLETNMNEVADFMFNSMIGKVVCKFTGRKIESFYLVNVYVNEESLAKTLIENSFATKIEASPLKKIPVPKTRVKTPINSIKKYENENLNLGLNETYELVVTHIETFREFYIKLIETDLIKSVMNNMCYFYEKKINLPQPALEPEYPCVYYDYECKEWHRSKIIHVYDDYHCLIRLVDTGRTKYVNRRDLREIHENFLGPQCQGTMACLDGLADYKDEDIDETILLKFKEIALNKKFLGKVVKIDTRNNMSCYTLNLFDENSESVYHVLVDNLDNSVLNLSQKFKPTVQSKFEETQISMNELSLNESVAPKVVETKKPRPSEYYFYEPLKIDSETKYSVNVSNYDSRTCFHVQLNSEFVNFDSKFDQFQESCETAIRVNLDEFNTITDLSKLAVGARFYEDSLWYRAKILTRLKDDKVSVEFVDYGNVQETQIVDLVYLTKEFAQYPPSTVKIDGLAYDTELSLSDELFEKTLLYGNLETTDVKFNWDMCFFRLSAKKTEVVLDDFYALLYPLKHLKSDFYIPPGKTDAILSLNNENEIKTCDILTVRLCNIEQGLKYIYFNLKSSLPKIEKMESNIDPLVRLSHETITMNQYFMTKIKNKLYRCVLLAKTPKNKPIILLIDYGRREILNSEMECYMMPMSLYNYGVFSIHCRLTLADNIEKVWTRDEKDKFFQKIKPSQEYEIKFMTKHEPFLIEFYDKNNTIDFQFNQIISRMVQTEYETQTIVNGFKTCDGVYNLISSTGSLDSDKFKIYVQSDKLFDTLIEFTEKMTEYLKQNVNNLRVTNIKKGDIYLTRTKSLKFLNSIKCEKTRTFVSKYYSRILVTEKKNFVKLFYIDFGFEDTVQLENEVLSPDYKILMIPLAFKIHPQFVYQLKLNKLDYIKKISSATKMNDFIDSDLIGSSLGELTYRPFRVDFSNSFYQLGENTVFQVDLFDETKNKDLIDLLISTSFKNISDCMFESVISHVNSVEDFYIQKTNMNCLLEELQETIQQKVRADKLQKLKKIETMKLCVAKFEDELYYRAKIIGYGANSKQLDCPDILIDVFYIDFGNTSQVKINDIREITPDLIDRFPKNFAINCRLDLCYSPSKDDLTVINECFLEIFDGYKFCAKVKNRLTDNKYNESGFYLIELFEAQTKESVLEIFKNKVNKELNQMSCVQFNGTMSDSLEDDKAIAESLNDDTVANATVQESILVPTKTQNKLSDTWETTALDIKNYDKYNETLSQTLNQTTVNKPLNDTWETTDINLKNFDLYNETLSRTVNQTQVGALHNESLDNSELYSTANSSQIEKTLSEDSDEYVTLKNCIISFMHSSTDLFIQEENFDQKIGKIQPVIDNCLDPFDLAESNLCIGQFKEDELFYRCKVIQWSDTEPFCELIDFGNRDNISIDTVTKMSQDLIEVKPLSINCSLGFDLPFESQAYKQLDDLVNLEIRFDVRVKQSDLNEFYDRDGNNIPIKKPVLVELIVPKNGLKISKEILEEPNLLVKINEENIVSELQNYYNVKQEPESFSGCKTSEFERKKDDDEDKDRFLNGGSSAQSFKTSTQINMATTSTEQSNGESEKSDKPSDINFYVQEESLDESKDHPKNLTVDDFENSKWSQDGSVLEPSVAHPKNLTVSRIDESNWSDKTGDHTHDDSDLSQNDTILDDTKVHPKNLTVSRLEDSKWSPNQTELDNTQAHPKNLTVSRLEESNWNRDETVLDDTNAHPKNLTVSRLEDSKWSVNETQTGWSEDSKILNESEAKYICRSINENDESVWLEDPDESGFNIKNIKKTRSNLDATRLEETPEYTQILTGDVIHVNSIDNFFFQSENADVKLMNMRDQIDKCVKRFDRAPKVGDFCIARYHVDGQFYRAQIIEVKPVQMNMNQSMNSTLKMNDQRLKIRYIDYGNEDFVNLSELFKCEHELKQIEPLALKCELNMNKKLTVLIQKLNELKKDTTEIIKYFKVLTGRSKVVIKVLKQVNIDLKVNRVDLFIDNENICDLLLSEALACMTSETKSDFNAIKITVPSPEFMSHVINIRNEEFSKVIKLKNLSILNKIDDLIDTLINQSVVETENFNQISQCLAQVPQNLIETYKLNTPVSRVEVLSEKSDKCECNFIDFDHRDWIPKSSLQQSNPFINKIQPAVDKYELNLKNSDLISSLSREQKIQLQEIFKNLINYDSNTSISLKTCVLKARAIRLFDPERENLEINTILEMSIHLMMNPFCGRVTHCESDYTEFDVINESVSSQSYKTEMNKLYLSTGLFDYQVQPDDMNFKIGSLCLFDSSTGHKYLQQSDSVLSLAEHCIEDDKTSESTREISRGLILDETEEKCVILSLDSGKQLTLKKTRLRIPQDIGVLETIPYMLIKCKVLGHVEKNSTLYRQIHRSRYYGDSIKLRILETWNHEFDIKGLHKIVKINSTDYETKPVIQPQTNYYTLSHVNSLNSFYIHPHDVNNQLKFIQEQIEIEVGQKKNSKNPPKLGKIYAVREHDSYRRVLLINNYVSSSTNTESYQAFFVDYGHVKKVYLNEIFTISDSLQSIAPQSICCKLNGFERTTKIDQNFLNVSESFNESGQQDETLLTDEFIRYLKEQKFQASIYKQWVINKKIINFVPLQSDNLKPIEIVVHLNDKNLSDLLKNLKFKKLKPVQRLPLNFESEFKVLNLVTPNEIWVCLNRNIELYTNIQDQLKGSLNKLTEMDIRPGGVLVIKIHNEFKRAVVIESCKIKAELNIRLNLIDYGEIVYSGLDDLYKLPDSLYDIEPLGLKLSLGLDLPDKQTETLATEKLKSLITDLKGLRFKVLGSDGDLYKVKILNLNVEMEFFMDTIKDYLEKKMIIYDQVQLPIGQPVKVQLTNVDTAKHFGIVQTMYNEKRVEFISRFHQWHKENKKSLNLLIEDFLGKPCAVSSVQIGKWCRGLVVQCDLTAQMSNVYLIDFCKTLTVTNDRLYKIEQPEFLSEPSYVHRCFLQEEQEQLQRFSKYIDLLKSTGMDLNLVSIDNLEILVECLDKFKTPLHVQSNIENYQYKIRVLDIKRVKSPLPQSPYSALNNSARIKLNHQQVKFSNSFCDETTENILCSTYKENYVINDSRHLTMIQSEHKDYQSDTFSAITESTRIQTLHDTDNMTLCETRRREETSNWIKDFDEHDEEKFQIYSELNSNEKNVRVRVLPQGFSPKEFFCQRLDLKNSYDKLQNAMNEYYQKIVNASKSLEADKANSMRSDYSDSLETDLFMTSFNRGDFCAVYMGKSWARCQILDIDSKTAMVECVDDGRKQPISVNRLEKLSDNFKIMPRYCIKCKFSGLDSIKLLSLDLTAVDKFERFLCDSNDELTIDILDVKKEEHTGESVYEINLFVNKRNVLDLWLKD